MCEIYRYRLRCRYRYSYSYRYAGRCLALWGEKHWFVKFANFRGVSIPTKADLNLPMWLDTHNLLP